VKVSTAAGATFTRTGAEGATDSGAVMRGCVFFISTVLRGRAAGSGKTEMRAVSFLGPAEEAGLEATRGRAAPTDGFGIKGGEPAAAGGSGVGGFRKPGGGAMALEGAGGNGA
jgi:hypothetical protein